MTYFLRYTKTPDADLERGTSLHLVDDCFADSTEGAEYINDEIGYAVVLNGLCAHSVDANNEEDAIDEAISTVLWARKNAGASGNYPEGNGYAAYLFEGVECNEDCEDGVLFHPKKIIANISEIAF